MNTAHELINRRSDRANFLLLRLAEKTPRLLQSQSVEYVVGKLLESPSGKDLAKIFPNTYSHFKRNGNGNSTE